MPARHAGNVRTSKDATTVPIRPSPRPLLRWLNRHRRRLLAGLGLVLLAGVITVFHPAFQTRMANRQLAGMLDSFSVERLHVLPWAVQLQGLALSQDDMTAQLSDADIRFNPLRALFGTVAIRRLHLDGLAITLAASDAPAEPAAPFPGLFALLEAAGYGLALADVAVSGHVDLQAASVAAGFTLEGGPLAPGTDGSLALTVDVNGPDGLALTLSGPLRLRQGEPGRFERLGADIDLRARADALPHEERLAMAVALTPRRETAETEADRSVIVADRFDFDISRPARGEILLSLTGAGELAAPAQQLGADFRLASHDGLARLWLPDTALPDFDTTASGTLAWDLAAGSGTLRLTGDLGLTQLDAVLGRSASLPERLDLSHELALRLDSTAATLSVETANAGLRDAAGQALVDVQVRSGLTLPLDDPAAPLAADATLGSIALTGLPVTWLNGLLPEPWFTQGSLAGRFEITSGGEALHLAPLAPLALTGVQFTEALDPGQTLALQVSPRLHLEPKRLRAELADIALTLGTERLADGRVEARLARGSAHARPELEFDTGFAVSRAAELPLVARHLRGVSVPAALSLHLEGALEVGGDRIDIAQLHAALEREGRAPLLDLRALQPFAVALGEASPTLDNPAGELARIVIDDIDLAWFDALLPAWTIAGGLDAGRFLLSAGSGNTLALRSEAPLRLRDLRLADASGPLVEQLALAVRTDLDYGPDGIALRWQDLDLEVAGQRLAAGSGSLRHRSGGNNAEADTPEAAAPEALTTASGSLRLNLAGLPRIPALARHIGTLEPRRDWRLDADFGLRAAADRLDIDTLKASITADGRQYVELSNAETLVLRPRIPAEAPLASHLTGAVAASIQALSSNLLEDLVDLGGLAFEQLDAEATLRSDGQVLTANLGQGLSLEGVRISADDGPLLAPFSLRLAGRAEAHEQQLTAALETLSIRFAGYPDQAAVTGSLALTLVPSATVPLQTLQARLDGNLPALLDQPVLLPGHRLTAGGFHVEADVDEDHRITALARLEGLAADKPLALQSIGGEAQGRVADDGRGFHFDMPVTGEGRTGTSDGLLTARFAPGAKASGELALEFTSEHFYLNDVLAAVAAISAPEATTRATPQAQAEDTTADAAPARPASTADSTAFWDVLPMQARLRYRIEALYYTDYLVIDAMSGEIIITPRQLALGSLAARVHDSPMQFNGTLDFLPDTASPYALDFAGSVRDFDLNRFFSELVPGNKPRAEGLFSVDVSGSGDAPNMAQFRNELFFDLRMTSREGLFRPLPPDSVLMAGASDVLGIVGEGLSYMPTGGFGAGAVSRLVKYIEVIDYDLIDIHVLRDDSRDIVIEEALVQSPNINLVASGGIDYADGRDILDSPLKLDARLDMTGKGAAILYSLNLLQSEQNRFGYGKGPAFQVRGTPTNPESNFAGIINTAADGAIKGGVIRPFAGLIGNVRHHWFGETPLPYLDEQSLENDEAPTAKGNTQPDASATPAQGEP